MVPWMSVISRWQREGFRLSDTISDTSSDSTERVYFAGFLRSDGFLTKRHRARICAKFYVFHLSECRKSS